MPRPRPTAAATTNPTASTGALRVLCAQSTITEEDARPGLADLPPGGARCCDCGTDTQPLKRGGRPDWKAWDLYVATDEAWVEARMAQGCWDAEKRWRTGFLCLRCLGKRLGRVPVPGRDLLVWPVSESAAGLKVAFTPEYLDRVREGRGY